MAKLASTSTVRQRRRGRGLWGTFLVMVAVGVLVPVVRAQPVAAVTDITVVVPAGAVEIVVESREASNAQRLEVVAPFAYPVCDDCSPGAGRRLESVDSGTTVRLRYQRDYYPGTPTGVTLLESQTTGPRPYWVFGFEDEQPDGGDYDDLVVRITAGYPAEAVRYGYTTVSRAPTPFSQGDPFVRRMRFTRPAIGRVTLGEFNVPSDPDNSWSYSGELLLEVRQQSGRRLTREVGGCEGLSGEAPAVDFTDMLGPGLNAVTVRSVKTCGFVPGFLEDLQVRRPVGTAASGTGPCGDVLALWARGSGTEEQNEFYDSFTAAVRTAAPGGVDVVSRELGGDRGYGGYDYPAVGPLAIIGGSLDYVTGYGIGGGSAYKGSVRIGADEGSALLADRVLDCPDEQLVLGGYSQGAHVMGDVLADLPTATLDRIRFVALFGDPKLDLPKGSGPWPAACRGEYEPWRRGNPSCYQDGGLLEGRSPYVPERIERRTGSWCHRGDPVCNDASFGSTIDVREHFKYPDVSLPKAKNEIRRALGALVGRASRQAADEGTLQLEFASELRARPGEEVVLSPQVVAGDAETVDQWSWDVESDGRVDAVTTTPRLVRSWPTTGRRVVTVTPLGHVAATVAVDITTTAPPSAPAVSQVTATSGTQGVTVGWSVAPGSAVDMFKVLGPDEDVLALVPGGSRSTVVTPPPSARDWAPSVVAVGPEDRSLPAASAPLSVPASPAPFTTWADLVRRVDRDLGRSRASSSQTADASALAAGRLAIDVFLADALRTAPTAAVEGQVVRLYSAYFRRLPDRDGLLYWTDRVARGQSLSSASAYFARSSEFRALYGTVDDASFVRLVYRNVLDRDPDADGASYWKSRLAGGISRGRVMLLFSEAPENKSRMQPTVNLVRVVARLLRRSTTRADLATYGGAPDDGAGDLMRLALLASDYPRT